MCHFGWSYWEVVSILVHSALCWEDQFPPWQKRGLMILCNLEKRCYPEFLIVLVERWDKSNVVNTTTSVAIFTVHLSPFSVNKWLTRIFKLGPFLIGDIFSNIKQSMCLIFFINIIFCPLPSLSCPPLPAQLLPQLWSVMWAFKILLLFISKPLFVAFFFVVEIELVP